MHSPSKRFVLDTSLEVDWLCDQFEQEQSLGNSPQIETYLEKVKLEVQAQLFEQILALELEALPSRPLLADYVRRFPNYEAQIQSVWEEHGLLDWTDSKISRFQILEELARGGMGVVFLALDPSLQRRVAIKLLTRERQADANWLAQLQQEARLASGLNHPNVLTIYDIGEDQGVPFIASEYVEGITLSDKMGSEPLPIEDCLRIASQICSGMAGAHRAGIIHRDLKTDNVMVRNDGLVKILDFGLAQNQPFEAGITSNAANDHPKAQEGRLTGTVHFMSPEQSQSEGLTGATDVFSFGVLFYQMLTGRYPFVGSTVSEVLDHIRTAEPKQMGGVPPSLQVLVNECLEKDPTSRPDFMEILAELELIREGEAGDHESLAGIDETGQKLGFEPSGIRYAQSGDVNIAWQTIGEGPIDIVFVMGWVSHLDWFWKDPSFANFLRGLAQFSRVILFDKRGTGLSDRVPLDRLPDLETRMDDVRAVMEAAGSERAVLCGISEGGPLCALFAATHPSKTMGLVMLGSYSRRLWAEDYPWGPTAEQRDAFLKIISRDWGGPVGIEERAPSMANDPAFRSWWANYLRMGASPGAAVALTRMNAEIDVRPVLPTIRVPTLVVHRTEDRCLLVEEGRYLAERIPNAKFVEFPGEDHLPFVGDTVAILDEIESFMEKACGATSGSSVLATVLCINVEQCESAENLIDFGKAVSEISESFRGTVISANDKTQFVVFDGPLRSVQCALKVCEHARNLCVAIRCGLDTGRYHRAKEFIAEGVVDRAREVADRAALHEVLLTKSLRNLLSNDQLEFVATNVELSRVARRGEV